MRKLLTLLLVLMISFEGFAQCNLPTNPPINPQDINSFCHKQAKRQRNMHFVRNTLYYSPLSYACLPSTDLGSPKGSYILSADIIPEFVIGGRWMPFPIHLTARYKVRILRNNKDQGDSSLPVRTPSFMPGATIFFPIKFDTLTNNISYLSLSFFHHSNGQDGKEFKTPDSLNTYNGNFSTNFIEPAFHYRHRKDWRVQDQSAIGYHTNYADLYFRAGCEIHFNTADGLKASYGTSRLNLTGAWVKVNNHQDLINGYPNGARYDREKYRLVFNSTLIMGRRNLNLSSFEKRVNFDFNYYYRVPSSPNTALFIGGGYYGSDPYNIYYQNNYWFIRAGLALGFFITPNIF